MMPVADGSQLIMLFYNLILPLTEPRTSVSGLVSRLPQPENENAKAADMRFLHFALSFYLLLFAFCFFTVKSVAE